MFSNHWKIRPHFSNHWKNIFQSLENPRFADELPDCAKSRCNKSDCSALIRAQSALKDMKLDGDAQIGVDIIRRACEAPLRQLTANAGVDGSSVVQDVRNGKASYGYNVATGEYVDMLKAGIIDPTKVTRGALQNAASIAGLLLVTEAMVADIPKKDPPPAPAPGGMGGMDGMY